MAEITPEESKSRLRAWLSRILAEIEERDVVEAALKDSRDTIRLTIKFGKG